MLGAVGIGCIDGASSVQGDSGVRAGGGGVGRRGALGRREVISLLLRLRLESAGILRLLLLEPAEVQGRRRRDEEDIGKEERRGSHGAFFFRMEGCCGAGGFPVTVCVRTGDGEKGAGA